jgi:hypothetical protein
MECLMNPYQCGSCGGEFGHDTDCPMSPANIAAAAAREQMSTWEKVRDWWDLVTARASLRWRPLRQWYVFWTILKDRRSLRDAYLLAKGAK